MPRRRSNQSSFTNCLTKAHGQDWRLPTKDELNLLYQQSSMVVGFARNNYWSSKELDRGYAWGQDFFSGIQYGYDKADSLPVRAVRDF